MRKHKRLKSLLEAFLQNKYGCILYLSFSNDEIPNNYTPVHITTKQTGMSTHIDVFDNTLDSNKCMFKSKDTGKISQLIIERSKELKFDYVNYISDYIEKWLLS